MFEKVKLFIFLAFFAGIAVNVSAQNISVSGTITDTQGETLPGVNIIMKGTTIGTVTDIDGKYQMSVPDRQSVLAFSFVGFTPQEIQVGDRNTIDVVLVETAAQIDEVVVVGYGTQKVRDLTAPISVVRGEDLAKQLTANPMSALQGKVSGVQIINSGVPGASPGVKIRGTGSIGDYANPLYIVDGVFVDNIDFLNSGDVESMNVLKDASAAAIYGVRAANGVVLITTKKGTKGRMSVVYDGYAGLQVPVNIMPLTNREQYVELLNEANKNTTGYVPKNAANYPASTDWYRELVRNAVMHSHSLDVSGATDVSNYSLGVNYFYQDGIMDSKNDYERFNIRGRFDQTASDWLKIGMTTLVSSYTQFLPNNDAVFGSAFVNPPVYSIYDDKNAAAYPERFGSPQTYGFGNAYGNPFATAYYNNHREKGIKTIASAYAEISLFSEKLKLKSAYNLSYNQWNNQNYQPEYLVGGSQGLRESKLTKSFGVLSKQIWDNTLTYADVVEQHRFSVMLGQSMRIEKGGNITGTAVNVPGFDDQSIYLTNGSWRNQEVTDGGYRYRGLSGFMRGTYGYAGKYMATVTFRADGSSKYNDHWGYFPSVGLGWMLSEENFMKNQQWTDYLKVRASWGLLGNDNVPANSSYILGQTSAGTSGVFGDILVDGVGAQTVYRNFLKWETVSEFNIGADVHLCNSRLSVEMDYYNRTTYNVVFHAPIASGGGVVELLSNNGTVRNQGIELTLNWNEKLTEQFSYHIGLNATTVHNKVLALNGRDTPIPGASVRGRYATSTQIGYPIGSFFGYEIDGVYASESEALRDPVSQSIKDAGYFKYKDQNGDKVIDDNDRVYLGSPIPWLITGLDFGGKYRNFDFSINFQGQFGNKLLNAKRMNRDIFADGNYDRDFYDKAWLPDRKSSTYPSPEAYNSAFIQQANSFFVEGASYFRIQNIQAGYNFDHKVLGVENLRIYVSAQRPFTYFRYNGFTPEVGGSPIESGIDRSVYPMQAIYAIGLKANF